jgi:serine/threonine protein kinase
MKQKTKKNRKGGALCKSPYDSNIPEHDIYTIDSGLETNEYTDNPAYIFTDKHHPHVIIKLVKNPHEYKILKLLEHTGFTPKLYGFYKCNGDRAKLKSFQPDSKMYIVMEKIEGHDLLELIRNPSGAGKHIIDDHIDEIYRLYNILMDKGFIHTDLFLQNIILSRGKIYFIDFEYVINTQKSIPLTDRLSFQQLKENLIKNKKIYQKP